MDYIAVTGGKRLRGEIPISGAKNSVLPLLAATILFREPCTLSGCPRLTDVEAAIEILRCLGCQVFRENDRITVDSRTLSGCEISQPMMKKMRSSILFLGPLMARTGRCSLYQPGGCKLGARPIDLHLKGVEQLGAKTTWDGSRLTCCGKLIGKIYVLPYPSVGATENIIMAALGAAGMTTIFNAAREPEVGDLIGFLTKGGAKIQGRGTSVLRIWGGLPKSADYRVVPDRAEAATYLAASAAAGGSVCLKSVIPSHLTSVLACYKKAGCKIRIDKDEIFMQVPERLFGAGFIRTEPYPGFPTDAQAPVMASLVKAQGVTVFDECVFSDRYRHVPGLKAMGADIETVSSLAVVSGTEETFGAAVEATDLRGGAAMVVAALGASGESQIFGIEHLRRGYENMEVKLQNVGADIREVRSETGRTK